MNLDKALEKIEKYSKRPSMYFITHEGFVIAVSLVIEIYSESIGFDISAKITQMHLDWLVVPGGRRSNVIDSEFSKMSPRLVQSMYGEVYTIIGKQASDFIKSLLLE